MNLGRHYKRAKWEALIVAAGLVLFAFIYLTGCQVFPTLTHPRSGSGYQYRQGDHIDLSLPNEDMPTRGGWGSSWDIQPLTRDLTEDGPDTTQKFDSEGNPNFGPSTGNAGSIPALERVQARLAQPGHLSSRFNYHRFHIMRDLVIYGDKPDSGASGFDVGLKYTREF